VSPHTGRGGWTWYTGSAAWMYRAGIEGILGIRCKGDFLFIDPCIPAAWPGFEVTVERGTSRYEIRVANPVGRCGGLDHAELDGKPIPLHEGCVRVTLDSGSHVLSLRLGDEVPIPACAEAHLA
jgi:cyclic beta-1,2-glucan synthetase